MRFIKIADDFTHYTCETFFTSRQYKRLNMIKKAITKIVRCTK